VHRQDGQRERGPDTVGAQQGLEAHALVAAGEAVQRLGVFADVMVHVDEHLGADVSQLEGGGRGDDDAVPHAADLDHDLTADRTFEQRAAE